MYLIFKWFSIFICFFIGFYFTIDVFFRNSTYSDNLDQLGIFSLLTASGIMGFSLAFFCWIIFKNKEDKKDV